MLDCDTTDLRGSTRSGSSCWMATRLNCGVQLGDATDAESNSERRQLLDCDTTDLFS